MEQHLLEAVCGVNALAGVAQACVWSKGLLLIGIYFAHLTSEQIKEQEGTQADSSSSMAFRYQGSEVLSEEGEGSAEEESASGEEEEEEGEGEGGEGEGAAEGAERMYISFLSRN